MKLGLHLPQSGPRTSIDDVFRVARHAEDLGFHSVWLFDHLLSPTKPTSRYPGTVEGTFDFEPSFPYFEATSLLAALAVATRTIGLGTRVLVPILRSPVVLAKQLASIDVIARGRLQLGVSTGWMREEFDAVDVGMDRRLARLDEHIALMRRAWRDGISSFAGAFYQHAEAGFHPQPPRPGNQIPLLLGGFGDAALRRVARYADGWAVHAPPSADRTTHDLLPRAILAERLETLRRFCDEMDRDFSELSIVTAGKLSSPLDRLREHAELGVTSCALVSFAPPEALVERATRLAETIGVDVVA